MLISSLIQMLVVSVDGHVHQCFQREGSLHSVELIRESFDATVCFLELLKEWKYCNEPSRGHPFEV